MTEQQIQVPNPDEVKVKDLTEFCRQVGEWPENWTKMKAAEKRTAFRRLFLPEEATTPTFDPKDQFQLLAHEVENVSGEDVKKKIAELARDLGASHFVLGGLLVNVSAHSLYTGWGYETFKDWVRAETGFEFRKAQYLMSNYTRILELGIPWAKFDGIGWTKVYVLLGVPNLAQEIDEWVAKAKALDTDSLRKEVSAAKKAASGEEGEEGEEGEGTEGGEANTVQKKFRLHEDQADTVTSALDDAKERAPTEHDNVALDFVCGQYLEYVTGGGAKSKKAAAQVPAPFDPEKVASLGEAQEVFEALVYRAKDLAEGDAYKALLPISEVLDNAFDGEAVVNISVGGMDTDADAEEGEGG